MKKLWISAALVLAALMPVNAKMLSVKSVEPVAVPDGIVVGEAAISADGSFIVMSDVASTRLTGMQLDNGVSRKITDNGSILDLKMTANGSNVVYRQRVVDSRHRSHTALQATEVSTGRTVEIASPTRNFSGFALSENGAVATLTADNSNTVPVRRVKSFNGATPSTVNMPVVGINRGDLVVTVGNKTSVINPQGKGSYLWPSISPDGTKVVYYKALAGCFVCNLDGSNPVSLGYIHAPKWFGNDTVIGMQDIDDGTNVTASTIVATDLKGNIQELTDKNYVAMYPSGSVESGRIAFTDPMGKLYIINVE